MNWAGGSDATSGLGDDNLQSNTAAGGGLTRSSKLKAGTANYVVINDGTGKMSEEAQLAATRGGTGANLVPTNVGDVLQVVAGPALALAAPPSPATSRIFNYYRF